MEKLPPLEKVYEAWSAVADGRVTSDDFSADAGEANVTSSNGAKTYTITWKPDAEDGARIYTSNDNSSYWQGHAGYPVIAVLMEQGMLPYDEELAQKFADVNWNELNKEFKRDYAAAAHVLFGDRGIDAFDAQEAAEDVIEDLAELPIMMKRGSLRPPKG